MLGRQALLGGTVVEAGAGGGAGARRPYSRRVTGTSTGAASHQLARRDGVRVGGLLAEMVRHRETEGGVEEPVGVVRLATGEPAGEMEQLRPRVMGRVALSVRRRRNAIRSRIAVVVAAASSSAPAVSPSAVRPEPRGEARATAACHCAARSRSANSPTESSPSAASCREPLHAAFLDDGDLGGDLDLVAEQVVEELLQVVDQ